MEFSPVANACFGAARGGGALAFLARRLDKADAAVLRGAEQYATGRAELLQGALVHTAGS